MTAASIALEVAAALGEVAAEVGSGQFSITILKGQENPATPWDTGYFGEPPEVSAPALIQSYPLNMVDGTLITREDRRVLIPATVEKPDTSDRLVIAGKEHRIISVMELAPSGEPIYFEVQARV